MPRYRIPDQSKVESNDEQPMGGYSSSLPAEASAKAGVINHQSSHMTNRFKVVLVVLVVVLILVGVWVGSVLSGSKGSGGYTAVFLTSGDVYFGKLSWFPWPKLTSAWFLQRSVDQQNQPQVGLAPFSSVFWGPAGEIYLNPKQILFWAPIKSDSKVAQAIENPASVQQQAPPGGVPQQGQQLPPQQPPVSPEKKK